MNLTNFKIISWEAVKALFVIVAIVILSANMFMVYRLADINIGQTTIYQDLQDFHKEEMELLKEIKDGK